MQVFICGIYFLYLADNYKKLVEFMSINSTHIEKTKILFYFFLKRRIKKLKKRTTPFLSFIKKGWINIYSYAIIWAYDEKK